MGRYLRLVEADIEDAWLVIGMNRLRHAYLELAPELEPYFVTSHHDDAPGMLQTYSFRSRVGLTHWLSGWDVIVGIIDAVVTGVLTAVVCQAVGAGVVLRTIAAVLAALAATVLLVTIGYRKVHQVRRDYRAFPELTAQPRSGAKPMARVSRSSASLPIVGVQGEFDRWSLLRQARRYVAGHRCPRMSPSLSSRLPRQAPIGNSSSSLSIESSLFVAHVVGLVVDLGLARVLRAGQRQHGVHLLAVRLGGWTRGPREAVKISGHAVRVIICAS
jgi:hypothetical protein